MAATTTTTYRKKEDWYMITDEKERRRIEGTHTLALILLILNWLLVCILSFVLTFVFYVWIVTVLQFIGLCFGFILLFRTSGYALPSSLAMGALILVLVDFILALTGDVLLQIVQDQYPWATTQTQRDYLENYYYSATIIVGLALRIGLILQAILFTLACTSLMGKMVEKRKKIYRQQYKSTRRRRRDGKQVRIQDSIIVIGDKEENRTPFVHAHDLSTSSSSSDSSSSGKKSDTPPNVKHFHQESGV